MIKRMISVMISASMLLSGINVFADEPDLVEQLSSKNTAVELSEAISELSDDSLTELGIDLTEYNKLAYPEFVAEEILIDGFTTAEEFKTTFNSAVAESFDTATIYASYGAVIRTADTTAEDNTKPGVTFGNTMTVRLAETYIGFDIPNDREVLDAKLSVTYTSSNFAQSSRSSDLSNYSLEAYPDTPKTNSSYTQGSNYNKSTALYTAWESFIGASTEIASASRIKWSVKQGQTPPTSENSINDEIITALNTKIKASDGTGTTPLSIRMREGDNMYIISAMANSTLATNPHLTLTYDNTVQWHNNCTSTVSDAQTGVYDIEGIALSYGAEIDSDSWNSDNITLTKADTDEAVEISLNTAGNIDLIGELEDEASYILTAKNITDTDGNALKNRRIYFTMAGIYQSVRIESEQELEKSGEANFKVYGKMSTREVDVTADADITVSDDAVIEYSNGKIKALDYGYSDISVSVTNVDNTTVEADTLVLVPAVTKMYTGTEITYSEFAVIVELNDDLSAIEANDFGFEDALVGIGDEYYTLNGTDTEITRSEGKHQVLFIADGSSVSIYFDGLKLDTVTADSLEFTGTEYIGTPTLMRLYDTTPVIKNLTVTGMSEGDAVIGDTLTASYEYYDAEGDESTDTTGAWYISDTKNGTYTKISDQVSIEMLSDYTSKYVKYIVKPVNAVGEGIEYSTDPINVSLGKTLEKILSDIQNTDAMTVREVIEANANVIGVDLTGANKLAQPDYVYGELANSSFASIDEIVSKFEEAISKYVVTEKKSVKAFHSYSTADGLWIDDTNSERRMLHKYDGYITTDGFTEVDAIIGIDLTLFIGGDHVGIPDAYFVNEPWDYTNLDELSTKFAKATGTPGMTNFPYGNQYTTRAVSQEVIDSLTEGCALTIRIQNTGNCTVYSNGTTAAQRPYYTVTYDKTALMKKEAVFDIANGQLDVAHDLSAVNIDFLKSVKESTVNNTNITLVKDSDGTPVNVTVTKTADNKFTVEIPENSLEPETTYRLEMKNITDADGNALNDQTVRFTTETIIKNLSVIAKTSYAIGETSTATVNGLTVNGNTKRMSGITFSSDNAEVASVDSNGTITAIKRGTATITASYNNYDGSAVIRKLIVNVYNHNEGDSFETNTNAVTSYSYAGASSLPVNGNVTLFTSEYNNYAEVNYYDDGTNANAEISFGGVNVLAKSSANSAGWHQVVFDNRTETMKVYLDGELKAEGTFEGDNSLTASGSGIYVDNVNINDISGTVCSVQNVAVRGSVSVGGKLSANYGYVDPDNDKEDGTVITWYTSASENGSYKAVSTSETYTTTSAGYVKVGVTPKNMYEIGEEVISKAFKVQSEVSTTGSGGGGGGSSIAQVSTSNDSNLAVNQNKSFTDVPSSHWAYEAIMDMKNAGIVNGMTEQTFEPDGLVTRAQFAAMLVRVLDKNESEYADSFSDIQKGDWYSGVVQTAFDEGLINGFDGKFAPNDNITREQMVKMVMEAYKKLNTGFTLGEYDITFDDMSEAGAWSVQYIQAASSLKIVSGVGNNCFAPKDNATRAQAAVIINNMLR